MPTTEMARTRPENAQIKYLQCCSKLDATRKKEARMTKDNMAKDSNGRVTRYVALLGRGSGPVEKRSCSLMSHWGRRG